MIFLIPAKICEAIFQLDPLRETKINTRNIGKHGKGKLGGTVFQNLIKPAPSRINCLYVER